MGHCEMLLAVAGLDQQEIADRAKKLADGDWSAFPAAERAGFAFARKLSIEPWAINDSDRDELRRHFGPVRMYDVIWWACRCHYMTRVADAFQIPLERENVFVGYFPPGPKR
jgi:alkylhydroperoxidase family enzyme